MLCNNMFFHDFCLIANIVARIFMTASRSNFRHFHFDELTVCVSVDLGFRRPPLHFFAWNLKRCFSDGSRIVESSQYEKFQRIQTVGFSQANQLFTSYVNNVGSNDLQINVHLAKYIQSLWLESRIQSYDRELQRRRCKIWQHLE
jgi:hypothetical protein